MGHTIPSILNGKELYDGPEIFTRGDVTVRSTEPKEALQIADGLLQTFKVWRNVQNKDKSEVFSRAAELLNDPERKRAIYQSMKNEVGIKGSVADFVYGGAVEILTNMSDKLHLKNNESTTTEYSTDDRNVTIVKDPIGPVLAMAPWNAPPILSMRAVVYPLAAGCPVIYKTNENCPKTQYLVLKCLLDAGLSKFNVLHIVHADRKHTPELVETLLSHRAIRKINFTGASETGSKIAQMAAKYLKPVTLELGGKGAVIIDKDANITEAANQVVSGAWLNAGQICMSTERVFITKEADYDGFINCIKQTAENLISDKDETFLQPQISKESSAKIDLLTSQAISQGSDVIYHYKSDVDINDRVILSNVPNTADIYTQETFGPVCYINKVEDATDAVSRINDESDYGLSCAIWTNDIAKGMDLARQIDSGAVHINANTVYDVASVPHGGCKSSGWGKFGGQWGIDEFCYVKAITSKVV